MVRQILPVVGIWSLVSFAVEQSDGVASYPYGKKVGGMLIIDASGYFSAQVMDMTRPAFKVPDPRGGTPEEIKRAFEGYIGYYGNFDVDETQSKFTFHVKGSWLPNWIGEQIRYYKIEGNRMAITSAPTMFAGNQAVGKLLFERIK